MAEAADFQGTRPSPARRWLRRTASAVLGAPLLAGLLTVPAVAAPTAEPAKAPTGSRTVDVSLNSLSPSVPSKDDTLTVSGTLTNKGKEAISDAEVDLRVGPRLTGRGEVDDAAKRSTYVPGVDPATVGDTYTLEIPRLARGISQDFTLTVPVDKLGLDDPGVYQLGVSVSGRTARAGRAGTRHQSHVPALAARSERQQDEADLPLAADLLAPCHGGDPFGRPADSGLRQRRPGEGAGAGWLSWSRWCPWAVASR